MFYFFNTLKEHYCSASETAVCIWFSASSGSMAMAFVRLCQIIRKSKQFSKLLLTPEVFKIKVNQSLGPVASATVKEYEETVQLQFFKAKGISS